MTGISCSLCAERQRGKTPHLGDSPLTRDMWWCECGRGLGENVNLFDIHLRWRFCPRCGAFLNWKEVGLDSHSLNAQSVEAEANTILFWDKIQRGDKEPA